MLPAISDVILFCTLIINGAAVLNFKLPEPDPFEEVNKASIKYKLKELLRNLRILRVFVALWNMVVIALMIVMFGG
ncbi:Small integral membrane protein 7 [Balamuthia mandrillaris]